MDKLGGLYECLYLTVPDGTVLETACGEHWAMAKSDLGTGCAMFTAGHSIAPLFPRGLDGAGIRDAAMAIQSWNLEEASGALAAANSAFNTVKRAADLSLSGGSYIDGIDFGGKTVGMIGHLKGGGEYIRREAKQLYIIEREPKEGDLPDAACSWVLPECDIVIITGSAIINKTLPQLLSLCRGAYTILVGPSVPLCRELFDFGIDRLAGTIITQPEGLYAHVIGSVRSSVVSFGEQFVLNR